MLRFVPGDGGGWPVVVLLHGGGVNGDAMAPVATALAERGVIVCAPTYRHPLVGVGVKQMTSGEWPGENLLGDLACAVRTARLDAVVQGADTDRLLLVGYSLGAAFGATVAIVGDDPRVASVTSGPCVGSDVSAVPDAFFGWEGPYDWDAVAEAEFPRIVENAPEAIRMLGPLARVERAPSGDPVRFHLRSGDQLHRSVSHVSQRPRTLCSRVAIDRWCGGGLGTRGSGVDAWTSHRPGSRVTHVRRGTAPEGVVTAIPTPHGRPS